MDGEWVVVEKKASLGKDWFPKRLNNVIIKDQEENLSKRIIGLPGDTIEIRKGIIYLNEKKLQDPFGKGEISFCLVDENNINLRYWNGPNAGGIVINLVSQAPQKIPEGFVWVIGDNRRGILVWFASYRKYCRKSFVLKGTPSERKTLLGGGFVRYGFMLRGYSLVVVAGVI